MLHGPVPPQISGGLLLVNGSVNSTNGVTVTGGALGGTGTINDVVAINSGGTLSPGANGIGTLTINNNLTLSGTTFIEVNKAPSPPTMSSASTSTDLRRHPVRRQPFQAV